VDILVGILAVLIGLAVAAAGLRVFFILLPIWGFVVGFLAGAAGVTAIFGDGFLSTTLGIVIGLIVGLIFAVISYLFWYIGVLAAAGAAGAAFGSGLFAAIGVDADWLLFIIGLVFLALFVIAALFINFPTWVVVVSTAMSGAAIVLAGLMLIFDKIDREDLGTGVAWDKIADNWWIWLIWLVGAALGMGAQISSLSAVMLPDDKWTQVDKSAYAK
jgi:hypothetical protein